jgi:hypothetical protein
MGAALHARGDRVGVPVTTGVGHVLHLHLLLVAVLLVAVDPLIDARRVDLQDRSSRQTPLGVVAMSASCHGDTPGPSERCALLPVPAGTTLRRAKIRSIRPYGRAAST